MDALLDGAEVEPPLPHHDELSVEDQFAFAKSSKRGQYLREVARHGPRAAADQRDLVAVAKDQRPEAVPLGLVLPLIPLRNALAGRRQHGLHVQRKRKLQLTYPQLSIS